MSPVDGARMTQPALDIAHRRGMLLLALRVIVEEQAHDDGLWFIAEHAAEAYLQQALRRLHAAIERATDEASA